jgi:allantoin racemase
MCAAPNGFRLGLLNPNTTVADTEAMTALARAALPGAEVRGLTATAGHASIEGEVEHVAAAAQVVELVRAHPDLDGYLIACFDDPGVHAARELTAAPVVGIGHAAYLSATLVGRRFAVITTLRRGVAALEDGLVAHGLRDRCVGVLPLERPVREQGGADAVQPIVDLGGDAIERLGADVLVLACGAMAATSEAVGRRLGVPVCDGVAFGALTVHALWRAGLSTSKRNAYAVPVTGEP